MTATISHGPWAYAPNLSAGSTGSIHDDAQARSLGFQSALVGGSVLCAFLEPVLRERLGRAWFERGFFKLSFIAPVYTTDEIRAVVEELEPLPGDEALVRIGLEKRSGERATAGYAGVYRSPADAVPPWQRPGEPPSFPPPPDADPLPEEPLGTAVPSKDLVVSIEESGSRRRAAGDSCPWYEEVSPWGGAIVPAYMNLLVNLDNGGRRPETAQARGARAGMNGTFQLLMTGPLFAGQPYTLDSKLAEKGLSGRTAFRTAEFTITDGSGQRLVLARQKARWFLRDEA